IAFHIFGDTLAVGDSAYPALVALVLPKYLTGFYCAVIFGAVLSTYNSLLNSAATLFCFDIYKPVINPNASDEKLIQVAKRVGTVLAIFSMIIAPFTMYAEGGLFEVMRRFTGFFNIPTITLVLVGFFSKRITALSAKVAVFVHIVLYTLLIFVLKVKINYIHIMGILFVVNVLVMNIVTMIKPGDKVYIPKDVKPAVNMRPWKRLPEVSTLLLGSLVLTYIILSPIGLISSEKLSIELVGPQFKYAVVVLIIGMMVLYTVLKKIIGKVYDHALVEEERFDLMEEELEALEI
ncbi:MAG: sodium:solute symporter family transporter, partial [Fusobacteriaceae bacterium]